MKNLPQRVVAEALGTAMLLAAVVGSGIMGERLAGGNVAVALLANTLATGAALVALILTFGPISGAHFNPAVTFASAWQGYITWADVPFYVIAQIGRAFLGGPVSASGIAVRGGGLHHGRVLVHGLDVFRQSCRDAR
jgi:glycerol uptake facilitator-like aquaporin